MSHKQNIALSVSAVAAALSALAHTSHQNPDVRMKLSDPSFDMNDADKAAFSKQQDVVRAAFVGAASEAQIRMNMGVVIPRIDFDPDTMESSWIRLANANYNGVIDSGDRANRQEGRLLGPNSDSTLNDNSTNNTTRPGVGNCYSNCHGACHGSRGWR